MKIRGLIIFIFVLNLFMINFITGVGSSGGICVVESRNDCVDNSGNIVMGLSSNTNAHSELVNQGNYNAVLCCYFGTGDISCTGLNKIVGLSSDTNAHAEIPDSSSPIYSGSDICYEDLECISLSGGCNSEYDIEMISLSLDVNAHTGNFPSYNTKICCKQPIGGGSSPIAYWADNSENFISSIEIIPGVDFVKMILKDTGLAGGTIITFNIYEYDFLINPDEHILTSYGTVESDGSVSQTWTITQANLDDAQEIEPYDFYFYATNSPASFSINNKASPLEVTVRTTSVVTQCSDYTDSTNCNDDPYLVAISSAEAGNPSLSCGVVSQDTVGCDVWTNCSCLWNLGTCISYTTPHKNCPSGTGSNILSGSCARMENPLGDDCGDGYLNYEINANWIWDFTNTGQFLNPGGTNYLKWTDNLWYYDPLNESGGCKDENVTTICPATIQLPFFGINQLLITLVILIIIYFLLKNKKLFTKKKIQKKHKLKKSK